jgi:hypothetical protein
MHGQPGDKDEAETLEAAAEAVKPVDKLKLMTAEEKRLADEIEKLREKPVPGVG